MYRQTEELYLPHRKAEQMNGTISRQALRRLPFYLDYLKKKQADGVRNISATTVANDLKLNEVQVRKDLASVSVTGGKRVMLRRSLSVILRAFSDMTIRKRR